MALIYKIIGCYYHTFYAIFMPQLLRKGNTMKDYKTENIVNCQLAGHASSGKTQSVPPLAHVKNISATDRSKVKSYVWDALYGWSKL